MSNKQKAGQVVGLGVGGLFLAGLLWLNLGSKQEVPRPYPVFSGAPVYVCATAPRHVGANLAQAQRFWTKHGSRFGETRLGDACAPDCKVTDDRGRERLVPCHENAITIDLRDQGFTDAHGDETFFGTRNGQRFVTVLVPEKVLAVVSDDGKTIADLPDDVEVLVLAHALGHTAGWDHSTTKGSSGTLHKRGELMHPKIWGLGWGDAGLPTK